MSDEKKQPDCGDDAKRDQVLKKMLGTPPAPKKPQKPESKERQ